MRPLVCGIKKTPAEAEGLGVDVSEDQPSRALDLATTFSTVKPNSLRQVPPGAEAPKRLIVMPLAFRLLKCFKSKGSKVLPIYAGWILFDV